MLPSEYHNRLYGFDIDEDRESLDLEQVWYQLISSPGGIMVSTSSGGDGLYALFAGPLARTNEEYKAHWAAIVEAMPPGAKVASNGQSKNFNHLRFLASDKNVWLATSEVTPLPGARGHKATSDRPHTQSQASPPPLDPVDAEALPWIKPPQDWSHWFGMLPTLKACGFSIEEVEAWSATGDKYVWREVIDRWNKLPVDHPEKARRKLRGMARKNGWVPGRSRAKEHGSGTPESLAAFVNASYENCTDAANFARLVRDYAANLVIALPDPSDPPNTLPDIYGVTPTGMLCITQAKAFLLETGRTYMGECYGLDGRELQVVTQHARSLRNANAMDRIRSIAPAAIIELERNGALPDGLVIKQRSDIDGDLQHIGTPQGALNQLTGQLVPADQARNLFIVASIPDDWNPQARHPKVDLLLPPLSKITRDSPEEYRAQILGYALTNSPRREFMWEVCRDNAGKTSFANAILAGLGDSYAKVVRREAIQPGSNHCTTSHNGDIRHFGKPARLCFIVEFVRTIHAETVKALSGGDRVPYRPINQEDRYVIPTAHLWVMGNSRDSEDAPALGISGTDANTKGIKERSKLLYRDQIPQDRRDETMVEMGKKTR